MTATRVWRWALSLLAGLFLVPLGVGTACAVATTSIHLYDAPTSVYDAALHSVRVYTDEAAPRAPEAPYEGVKATVVTVTGPLTVSLPVSVASNSGGWSLPQGGGGQTINGRWYTEHALERMAPNTPAVMAQLEARAMQRARSAGLEPGAQAFQDWWNKRRPDPRGIPSMVVEAEIANPGTTGVRVITNADGVANRDMSGGGIAATVALNVVPFGLGRIVNRLSAQAFGSNAIPRSERVATWLAFDAPAITIQVGTHGSGEDEEGQQGAG